MFAIGEVNAGLAVVGSQPRSREMSARSYAIHSVRLSFFSLPFVASSEGLDHASWLRQVESYLKDTGMAGLAYAWAMARR